MARDLAKGQNKQPQKKFKRKYTALDIAAIEAGPSPDQVQARLARFLGIWKSGIPKLTNKTINIQICFAQNVGKVRISRGKKAS